MVGEIRDKETAEIAIHASLTGHLVLSTIHTNDAAGAVTRLVEMEIEAFLVRSSVIGILAQRLVRLLCTDCTRSLHARATSSCASWASTPSESRGVDRGACLLATWRRDWSTIPLGTDHVGPLTFYRAKGCATCLQTGYTGRRGIYELMMIDDAVGALILKNADAQSIKRAAVDQGMDTLRDDGARKVLMGLTTVEEVLAATQEDVAVE